MYQNIINQMKKVLKYLIKLSLVVIIPVIVTILCIQLLIIDSNPYDNVSSGIMWGAGGILIASVFNAFVYNSFMSDTKLLPKYSCNFGPVVGFAISYNNNIDPTIGIILPFCIIEVYLPKNKKK
jgi:hypothetical protein